MQVYIPGEDTFFEVIPLNNGKKVIIYLSKISDLENELAELLIRKIME